MTDNPAGRQAGGEGFRVGARRVREEAQERLRKLRVARMKPRVPDAPAAPPVDLAAPPEPECPGVPDPAPAAAPDVAAAEPAAAPAPRPKRKRTTKPAAAAPAASELPAEGQGMTVSHAASEVARRAADTRPPAAPPPERAVAPALAPQADAAHQRARETAADTPDAASPGGARPDDAPSDLVALPGAGPGLIWLFGRAGVASMSDLARADAADLGARLGLVGELLDLSGWIDMARRHAEPSPAP